MTERVIEEIKKGIYDVVIMNYANPDMVGHTGNLKATIAAVKAVDECMGQVVDAVLYAGGVAIVTADHGNAETMVDEESCQPCTAHTTNKVPFILVGDAFGEDVCGRGQSPGYCTHHADIWVYRFPTR